MRDAFSQHLHECKICSEGVGPPCETGQRLLAERYAQYPAITNLRENHERTAFLNGVLAMQARIATWLAANGHVNIASKILSIEPARQLINQMHAEAIRDEEVTGGYYAHLKRTIADARKLAQKHQAVILDADLDVAGEMIERLRVVHTIYQGPPK